MLIDALSFLMLGSLLMLLFSGLPVAIILRGIGVAFCFLGIALGEMKYAMLLRSYAIALACTIWEQWLSDHAPSD